jgi:hypothetical protein
MQYFIVVDSMATRDGVGNDEAIDFLVNLKGKIGKSYEERMKGVKDKNDAERLESSCYEEQHLVDLVINMVKDYSRD